MRGLSLVEVEVLRSDWFTSKLSSSLSTLSAARRSDIIALHMALATLQGHGALSAGTPQRMAGLKSLGRVLGPLS